MSTVILCENVAEYYFNCREPHLKNKYEPNVTAFPFANDKHVFAVMTVNYSALPGVESLD